MRGRQQGEGGRGAGGRVAGAEEGTRGERVFSKIQNIQCTLR